MMNTIRNGITASLFFAIMTIICMGSPARAAGECDGLPTAQGPVSGVLDDKSGVCSFLGIPYAAAPVGELRFKKPLEHAPWTEPLATVKVGNQCPQQAGPMTDADIPMSEDCLYLNVWQPAAARAGKKPVMVFIHGGGFVVGSGGNAAYNGATLAKFGDVLVVTLNYRLSVPGFMAHPALVEAGLDAFNRGLFDQLAALKWVKSNIAGFGGDPENITLFGQSAGGMSVGFHLVSPLDAGLFKNVGIHSAPAILLNVGKDWALAQGLEIAKRVGCADPATALTCLVNTPAEKFLEAAPPGIFIMDDASLGDKFFYQPVIDGEFIPDAPYRLLKEGRFNSDARVLILSTKDESSYFGLNKDLKTPEGFAATYSSDVKSIGRIFNLDFDIEPGKLAEVFSPSKFDSPKAAYDAFITDTGFTCTAEIMAELISARRPEVYRLFHAKSPFKIVANWGAFHGSELPFLFSNFSFMKQNFRSKDNLALSKKTIELWSSFAHTGVPRAEGAPELPKYDASTRAYLTLDDELTLGSALKADECKVVAEVFEKSFKQEP